MTSPFHAAVAEALSSVREFAGVPVVYYRGSDSVEIDKAVIGRTSYTEAGGNNVEVAASERDYLIKATDLVLNSTQIRPAEHDRIIETANDQIYTYVVSPLAGLGDPASWSDPGKTTWRIHTQLDSVEDA